MSRLKALIVVAPLAVSTAAVAGPNRFTDSQFIEAARCQALMASSALGREDMRAIDALMKKEGVIRSLAVISLAQSAYNRAERSARHAGPDGRAALIGERDGPCREVFANGPAPAA